MDDCSDPPLDRLVDEVRRKVPYPIRYTYISPRCGNSTVLVNKAFLESEADHLAYMNTDLEFPDTGWLRAMMDCFESNAAIVYRWVN